MRSDSPQSTRRSFRVGAVRAGAAVLVVIISTATFSPSASAEAIGVVEVFGHNERANFAGVIGDMINGSGMNGNPETGAVGWPSGAGEPSTWTATLNGYQAEWQSQALLDSGVSTNSKIGWTVFDLGSTFALDELYVWHIRENSGRVASEFNVYVAESPTVAVTHGPTNSTAIDYDFGSGGWTLINTGGELTGTYRGSSIVGLGGISGRFVALEIISNGGDASRVGFAEVGITPVPEPAALAFAGLGLAGAAAIVRRFRCATARARARR